MTAHTDAQATFLDRYPHWGMFIPITRKAGQPLHLSIDRATLLAALRLVAVAAAKKTSLPILSSIRLVASDDGTLAVACTDMEMALAATVPAEVITPGTVCLPAALALALLARCADARLTLAVDKAGKVRLTGATTRLVLPGSDDDDFPHIPGIDPDARPAQPLATTTVAAFAAALDRVKHAVLGDLSRPVLAGINLRAADGTLTLEAADGFRCAVAALPATTPDGTGGRVLVPGQRLAALAAVLPAGALTLATIGTVLRLTAPDVTGILRTLDGAFPDLALVVPRQFKQTIRVPRAGLLGAAHLARVAATGQEHPLCTLAFGPDGLDVSGREDAEAASLVPLAEPPADPLTVHLGARYLADALGAFDGDDVSFCIDSPTQLVAVRSWGGEDGEQGIAPMHKQGQ